MPDFATLLSEHIHNKNIKTYALAQYCNLDRSNMYKIIKGQRKPSSLEMVEKMCKFMHLSPSEQADMEEPYHTFDGMKLLAETICQAKFFGSNPYSDTAPATSPFHVS